MSSTQTERSGRAREKESNNNKNNSPADDPGEAWQIMTHPFCVSFECLYQFYLAFTFLFYSVL